MRRSNKHRLSVKQFGKRHPDLTLDFKTLSSGLIVVYARKKGDEKAYAATSHINLEKAIYALSEACYKLAGLEAMDAQDWRDPNTGQVGVPLSRHHLQKRSAGRLDSRENLVGVSAETHAFQHEKSLPRKASEHR